MPLTSGLAATVIFREWYREPLPAIKVVCCKNSPLLPVMKTAGPLEGQGLLVAHSGKQDSSI